MSSRAAKLFERLDALDAAHRDCVLVVHAIEAEVEQARAAAERQLAAEGQSYIPVVMLVEKRVEDAPQFIPEDPYDASGRATPDPDKPSPEQERAARLRAAEEEREALRTKLVRLRAEVGRLPITVENVELARRAGFIDDELASEWRLRLTRGGLPNSVTLFDKRPGEPWHAVTMQELTDESDREAAHREGHQYLGWRDRTDTDRERDYREAEQAARQALERGKRHGK